MLSNPGLVVSSTPVKARMARRIMEGTAIVVRNARLAVMGGVVGSAVRMGGLPIMVAVLGMMGCGLCEN